MLRTGSYPATFMSKLKAHLAAFRHQPHLGVWAAGDGSGGTMKYDYSPLAAWVYRDDPMYFREMISARALGKTMVWIPRSEDTSKRGWTRPYLAFELDAYKWLAQFGPLTWAEGARAELLAAEAQIKSMDLSTMLSDYEQNELRADDKYKGKFVTFSATADAPRRATIGGITVDLTPENTYHHTAAMCFFDDNQTEKVSAISKGDTVKILGQVEGLEVDLVLRKCEIEN
jgi:hypothetical protein